MPRDKQPQEKPDILDNLFGDPAQLADDELDTLFAGLALGIDPAAKIHNIAETVAAKYRVQNKMPPDHVQAALDSTREIKTLSNIGAKKLNQIIDSIRAPFTGAVYDPAYAYRNRDGELESNEQDIIDELTDELQKDWADEEES